MEQLRVTVSKKSKGYDRMHALGCMKQRQLYRKLVIVKLKKKINLVSFCLELPPQYRINPTLYVSLLKPIT